MNITKRTPEPDRPQKVDRAKLIEAICQIYILGSATHERWRNEVIRTVETLDQLTEALNCEGCNLERSSGYLHMVPRMERKRHVHTAPVELCNPKIPNIYLIFQQSFHDPALELWSKLLQFWGQEKLLVIQGIQGMTKLKCQLVSQQQRNKLLCLCVGNIKLFAWPWFRCWL